jgi:hypothetical protein
MSMSRARIRWLQPALVVAVRALVVALADGSPLRGGILPGSGDRAPGCPNQTILIGGSCFDRAPSGPVSGLTTAADLCAAKGGYLPRAGQLFAARRHLALGDGSGSHSQFTDSYFYDEDGTVPMTIVVSSRGQKAVALEDPDTGKVVAKYEYVCSYVPGE